MRSAAAAHLFRCPKVHRDVLHWLECLGVPVCDRGDAAGEVWLRAWRSWPTFDPRRASAERWLNGIAVHVAARYHQRAQHRREELTDGVAEVVDPMPDASCMLATESTRLLMIEAMSELDLNLSAVLISHYIDEVPMARLAEAMGLPLSTLYRHRTTALAVVRAIIEREEAGEEL